MTLAPIHAARLTLRAVTQRDLDVVAQLLNDETTTSELSWCIPSVDEASDWLTHRLRDEHRHGVSMYAIEARELERVIGLCGFFRRGALELELGYAIRAGFQQRGYATEAVGAAIRAATREGYRIHVTVRPSNEASLRVLEKVGLRYVGQLADERGAWLRYCTSPPRRS